MWSASVFYTKVYMDVCVWLYLWKSDEKLSRWDVVAAAAAVKLKSIFLSNSLSSARICRKFFVAPFNGDRLDTW